MPSPRLRAALALLVVPALVLGACGDDGGDEAASGECATVEGGEVTIVAEDTEWSVDCIEAPVGEPFTVVVDNRDDIAHNFNVPELDASTPLEGGPVTQELELTIDDAGDYDFVCDPHPNMTGTITAS